MSTYVAWTLPYCMLAHVPNRNGLHLLKGPFSDDDMAILLGIKIVTTISGGNRPTICAVWLFLAEAHTQADETYEDVAVEFVPHREPSVHNKLPDFEVVPGQLTVTDRFSVWVQRCAIHTAAFFLNIQHCTIRHSTLRRNHSALYTHCTIHTATFVVSIQRCTMYTQPLP